MNLGSQMDTENLWIYYYGGLNHSELKLNTFYRVTYVGVAGGFDFIGSQPHVVVKVQEPKPVRFINLKNGGIMMDAGALGGVSGKVLIPLECVGENKPYRLVRSEKYPDSSIIYKDDYERVSGSITDLTEIQETL